MHLTEEVQLTGMSTNYSTFILLLDPGTGHACCHCVMLPLTGMRYSTALRPLVVALLYVQLSVVKQVAGIALTCNSCNAAHRFRAVAIDFNIAFRIV